MRNEYQTNIKMTGTTKDTGLLRKDFFTMNLHIMYYASGKRRLAVSLMYKRVSSIVRGICLLIALYE